MLGKLTCDQVDSLDKDLHSCPHLDSPSYPHFPCLPPTLVLSTPKTSLCPILSSASLADHVSPCHQLFVKFGAAQTNL